MHPQWNILEPDPRLVRQIQENLRCHPVTATVIANRQRHSAESAVDFLQSSISDLPSPLLLGDMQTAVERICRALAKEENILVIGDYDADGVTSTALMVDFLQAAGARVSAHLPHRIHEGYGFAPVHVMQLARPRETGLIITVDCGSSNHEAVAAASRFGIDTIITDHHNIDPPYPDACAVINPKKDPQPNPLEGLAGVGVAFYLIIALRTALREKGWWQQRPEPNLKAYCDLVAIGTIADMVPLLGVNRILTKAGLDQINQARRPGLQALLNAAGVHHKAITAEDIAFRIAPRINAAGRIAHAQIAMDLLCAPTPATAEKLAETLNGLNHRRQAIEKRIYDEIEDRMERRPDFLKRQTLLLAGADWHEGVLGIVAAKLTARYHRPVVLISTQNGIGKGSGRSIPQIDLFGALNHCAHLLERFGGHRLAAGLSVLPEKIAALREAFETSVGRMAPDDTSGPQLNIDSVLPFEQITTALMDELGQLEPYGFENPAPVFWTRAVHVKSAAIFKQRHRRMQLCQESTNAPQLNAIQFNLQPETPRPTFFDRLAFRLQWNHYRGARRIQMVVEGY